MAHINPLGRLDLRVHPQDRFMIGGSSGQVGHFGLYSDALAILDAVSRYVERVHSELQSGCFNIIRYSPDGKAAYADTEVYLVRILCNSLGRRCPPVTRLLI